ncbi:MAG: hypothetical protein HOO96_27615 [Polyangiaceae bacterium]|nr:hypothetical protein [Polyangiaceae bacterium]
MLAEGSGTAIQLRHVCGAAGDKHRVVFRQSDLRATLVNVSLAVTRAPVDAGADARVVDGGGVDAGPPFVVPASLTNRDIDVPMACRRYGKGVTEAFATVLLTLRWDEPHVATAVPMVAVEPFPNDGDPQKFAWPLRNNTAAPLDPLNRSVVSMRTYSYGIFVDGIEKESVSAWHRRYTWTLYLSQGDAPGQVKVTYNIDNVIQPDQLHYYSCKGVLQ